MLSTTKSYKKPNKQNRKKKVIEEHSSGEIATFNSHKRFPVIALPEIISCPIYTTYRRFTANSGAVSGTITIADMLNQFMVATTSVQAYSYVRALRIKKVRCLAPVTTQGTSVVLQMQPFTSDSSQNSYSSVPESYVDTSASIDVPAYLSLTPSIQTPFGSWHYSSAINANLLTINAPQGSCLDILFEFILNSSNAVSNYARTIVAGTAGTLYGAVILTNFNPVNVTSI